MIVLRNLLLSFFAAWSFLREFFLKGFSGLKSLPIGNCATPLNHCSVGLLCAIDALGSGHTNSMPLFVRTPLS